MLHNGNSENKGRTSRDMTDCTDCRQTGATAGNQVMSHKLLQVPNIKDKRHWKWHDAAVFILIRVIWVTLGRRGSSRLTMWTYSDRWVQTGLCLLLWNLIRKVSNTLRVVATGVGGADVEGKLGHNPETTSEFADLHHQFVISGILSLDSRVALRRQAVASGFGKPEAPSEITHLATRMLFTSDNGWAIEVEEGEMGSITHPTVYQAFISNCPPEVC